MATERLSMRQIREILRQKWVLGRPHREVAESLRIGLGTVSVVLERAKQAGLDWPTVQALTEEALEARLYTRPLVAVPESASRKGFRALYRRASRLFHELTLARADGTYLRLLTKLARVDVLLVDDWGLDALSPQDRRDFLELLDDRHGTRATILTSQVPVAQWHTFIGDPTLADSICDRLLHNAHRIVLKGPSRRKEGKLES